MPSTTSESVPKVTIINIFFIWSSIPQNRRFCVAEEFRLVVFFARDCCFVAIHTLYRNLYDFTSANRLKIKNTCYILQLMTSRTRTIGCVKPATDILGDKWTPLLLRTFANGSNSSLRFCNLQEGASGINPRTLSARLKRLEADGIIERVTTSQNRCEYRLTDRGQQLIPIIKAMERWSRPFGKCDIS